MFVFLKKRFLLKSFTLGFLFLAACDSGSGGLSQPITSSSSEVPSSSAITVDYTKAREMNARLGRGINFGNSWDSAGDDDCGWNNCIEDAWFTVVKEAGFNSIRLPVRWGRDAEKTPPYTISETRLAGVKEDIDISLALGMPIIINIHHYLELISAKGEALEAEKARFEAIWLQVAEALEPYPDSMLVFEILNEPNGIPAGTLNELNLMAYKAIRAKSPGKTIMVNPNGFAKFHLMNQLVLPPDGNLIISGHYYEPYAFSHQGRHGYACGGTWLGDQYDVKSFQQQFQGFVDMATQYFPDVNGGHIPLNMGEFGVSGPNTGGCEDEELPSDANRALWTKELIKIAESFDMSWHYWGFAHVGGFEAYDKHSDTWYPHMLEALIQIQ